MDISLIGVRISSCACHRVPPPGGPPPHSAGSLTSLLAPLLHKRASFRFLLVAVTPAISEERRASRDQMSVWYQTFHDPIAGTRTDILKIERLLRQSARRPPRSSRARKRRQLSQGPQVPP